MKIRFHLTIGIGVAILFTLAAGRTVTKNGDLDPSGRTLKGVLKFYREQPKAPESDSVENDSTKEVTDIGNKKHILDLQVTKAEEEHRPKTRVNSKVAHKPVEIVPAKEQSVVEDDNQERTTIFPVERNSDDEQLSFVSKEQLINRSDLDEDVELEDLDGCTEGDVTKVSCNTCVCSESKYFCSKRDCNDAERPLPPLQKASSKRKGIIKYHKPASIEAPSSDEPSIGESLQGPGNFSATKIGHGGNSPLLAQCIDGRTKPVDCNQCVCAMGQWACTKMSCIALTLREKASFSGGEFLKSAGTLKEHMNIDEDCMEGEAKQMQCNQCVCHQNSWACSDFECPSTIKPTHVEIVPESCQTEEDVKSKDCNICSCRRGVWVCTKNDCKQFGNRYFNPVSQKHSSQSDEIDQETRK